MATRNPCPSSQRRFSTGTRQFSSESSVVSEPRIPIFSMVFPIPSPGEPRSTRNAAMPRLLARPGEQDEEIGLLAVRDEGLRAVELVALIGLDGARAEGRRIGARAGLRERERAEELVRKKREPLRLLRRRSEHADRPR